MYTISANDFKESAETYSAEAEMKLIRVRVGLSSFLLDMASVNHFCAVIDFFSKRPPAIASLCSLSNHITVLSSSHARTDAHTL